jgi:hypothetical protein
MDEPPEISRSQSLPPGCIMEKKELEEAMPG